jgi:two-component system, OmpR family, response regulator
MSFRGSGILVVVDDLVLRRNIVRFLDRHGFRVSEAEDGRSGWKAVNRESFDLVIADQQLPHLNGLQLVSRLRQVMPKLPVLLLKGGGAPDGDREPGVPNIRKPFDLFQLLRAVHTLLARPVAMVLALMG